MRKFVITDRLLILPFNEPASELQVLQDGARPAPLGLHLSELTESVVGSTPIELPLGGLKDLQAELERKRFGIDPYDQVLVYRDNLFFDREFLVYFLNEAHRLGVPSQAVLAADDRAWAKYSIPLSSLIEEQDEHGTYYPIDLYYFPSGWAEPNTLTPIRVPSGESEKGYYNVPDSMTNIKLEPQQLEDENRSKMAREQDLTHYLTVRTCVPIQSWVHLYNANVILGMFSRGHRFEESLEKSNIKTLRVLWRAIMEQRSFVESSEVVKIGKNSDIDASAVINGPTTIGDNVKIGAGVVIDNCVIGDNVTIANNCHLMLSMVGHNCFLPFRAALFMTTLMDNTIVAQNTCLQMCVIGRNSFIGAGTTFTDFNLLPSPLKAINAYGELDNVRQPVIGGCVGHNVRVGSGMLVFAGRMIESDVVLIGSPERRVIGKSISYEMSDHLTLAPRVAALHRRLYPRRVTMDEEQVLEPW